MKKKILTLLFIGLTITAIYTQSIIEIEIGDGTTTTDNFPCNGNYDYSWTNYILTDDQIGNSLMINEILFEVANEPSNYTMNNQKLYLGFTTDDQVFSSFPNLADYNFTLVFEGSITWNGSGWQGVTLDETYHLNSRKNLQLVWINEDGSHSSGYPEFRKTERMLNTGAYNCSDNSFSDSPGQRVAYFPNTTLRYTVPGLISYSPANFSLTESLTPTLSFEVDDSYTSMWILFEENPDPWPCLVPDIPIENNSFSYTFIEPLEPFTDYYWTIILVEDNIIRTVAKLTFKTNHQMEGLGTEESPYLVDSLVDLNTISSDNIFNDKHFLQIANIDASATSKLNERSIFTPIGFTDDSPFTGSYDGQGFTISNLYINSPGLSFIGMFGKVDNAEISNLGLVNVEMTGNSFIGGLVGLASESEISNTFVSGHINGTGASVGGLVGFSENASIKNSYTKALVSSSNNRVGGIIGFVYNGEISNCYATGAVNGGSGLVGKAYNSAINYCYSRGPVSGSGSDIGGLIGIIEGNDNEILSSFWDMDTSGQSTSAGGMGKTDIQMIDLATYLNAGWDFIDEVANGNEDIWMLDPEINSGYPVICGLGYIAPEIISYLPLETDINLVLNSLIDFSITAEEVTRDLTYSWFVDDVEQENNTNLFSYQFNELSAHQVKAVVSNEDYYTAQVWNISVVVNNDNNQVIPLITGIESVYPNPFNPDTTIRYNLSKDSRIKISIYDLRGRLVRNLQNGFKKAGVHNLAWDGVNNAGKSVASGSFLVRMESSDGSFVRKIMLIK